MFSEKKWRSKRNAHHLPAKAGHSDAKENNRHDWLIFASINIRLIVLVPPASILVLTGRTHIIVQLRIIPQDGINQVIGIQSDR